jgi:predicted small secreted protein
VVRKFILALGFGALALSLSACNTVKGAGKDVQSVGEAGDDVIHGRDVN